MMNPLVKKISAVFAAGVWINFSEFFRNEVLLKSYWGDHYQRLGITFPSRPINGVIWIIWGFLFSIAILALSRKFTVFQTGLLGWFMAFVLMWIVTWNLDVLPLHILYVAVPLSLLESFVAAYITSKLAPAR